MKIVVLVTMDTPNCFTVASGVLGATCSSRLFFSLFWRMEMRCFIFESNPTNNILLINKFKQPEKERFRSTAERLITTGRLVLGKPVNQPRVLSKNILDK